ncbi:hypothetical protein ACEWY4_005912 [Coilia grayii]|uniref:Endonuclease/exonuclease/phosphatase domain-containing protein n=1 Tax=Coilia grayii TaxID=363190 RepID=A0ABD1KJY7_9TELE
MLGSFLYYALYPLSRVITSGSESLVKAALLINRKVAWDTGGTPPLGLANPNSLLLNLWAGENYLTQRNAEKTEVGESKCPEVMELEKKTDEIGPQAGDKAQEVVPSKPHIVSSQVALGTTRQENTGEKQNSGVQAYPALELETHAHFYSGDVQERSYMDYPVLDQGGVFETQPKVHGWHFPAGHGLADMVHQPYWQFPSMSYYPAQQASTEFKVMWRVWEDLHDTEAETSVPQTADQSADSVFEFTVMTYNILAQDLLEANPELYMHCSEKVLVWSTRLKGILQEIQTWQPDILCLQEAQENNFKRQLQPILTDMGYTCVYKQRTGSKSDGCAVCYQNRHFVQLSVNLLELRQERCELLDRDNVAIVLLLQPVTAEYQDEKFTPICVATTHLLFNPRRGDIKLAQLVLVLTEIESVVRRCKTMGRECEVILCGDLNSVPNMPLYQFITTGQLCYHGLPAWMISGQEDLSHQTHPRRLYAPLLPISLGISDNCQYVTASKSEPSPSDKLKYSHDFLLHLRYCKVACMRPTDLELIPGVTDNTPDPHEKQPYTQRLRNTTICHSLNFKSAYSHFIPGKDRPEVTTLHSNAGVTVDYIFYSARTEHTRGQTDKRLDGGLKLVGRLGLLSEADLWSLRGLPNEIFPSDHLSLLAKFQLPASSPR